jgi:hypothetical protein
MEITKNPFTTIKANDLNDDEVNKNWVDLSEAKGLLEYFSAKSLVAKYIIGGKGSGKTHLMRYFSSSAQLLRNKENKLDGIKNDGYYGIYFQSSSLHGSRFDNLNIPQEQIDRLFSYSFDLWLAGLFLDSLVKLRKENNFFDDELCFCKDVISIFQKNDSMQDIKDIVALKDFIDDISRKIDYEVNNSLFKNSIDIDILTNYGDLVFGIPIALRKYSSYFENVNFLYLADELENISFNQQKYINTLIREKKDPVTFRIGVRKHGVKTYKIMGSNERNKEGHEFDVLRLDSILSEESSNYENFAIKLIINRLVSSDLAEEKLLRNSSLSEKELAKERKEYLLKLFENPNIEEILKQDIGYSEKTLNKFISKCNRRLGKDSSEYIRNNLYVNRNPVVEKAAIHLFSQRWSRYKPTEEEVLKISDSIKTDLEKFKLTGKGDIKTKLDKYRTNYVGTILREKHGSNSYQYVGLPNLLLITKGFPRHIITLLRHIYQYEVFAGRKPFDPNFKISVKSQILSLKEAADWFYNDSVSEGELGKDVSLFINKLCEIFRIEMYADKPVECSAISFSINMSQLNPDFVNIIKWAERIRVIISHDDKRQDKNSQNISEKYHLNGLLCPRWGLPISRRGSLSLTINNAELLIDSTKDELFNKFKNEFESSRNAPFLITSSSEVLTQQSLDF